MDTITVQNTDIRIKEWNGQRVVTFKDIDEAHNIKPGSARSAFYRHRDNFIENKDYFKLTGEQFDPYNDTSYKYPKGVYVVTESGYLMIVKPMNDEISWKIQRELVNSYFKVKVIENEVAQLPSSTATWDKLDALEKFLDVQIKMIEMERENARALREENADLRGMVKDLVSLVARQFEPQPEPVTKPIVQESKPESQERISYTEFKRQVNKACESIVAFHIPKYKDKNSILHEAYSRIRNEYGIVYEQEKKEYYNDTGKSPTSTLELQWYIEQTKPACKNLLLCKLNTIYKEVKDK